MSIEAIAAGIGAVITAVAGMVLLMREFRNREHKAARAEVNTLMTDLYGVDNAYIELRRYTFEMRQMLADLGADVPTPPTIFRLSREPVLPRPPAKKAS